MTWPNDLTDDLVAPDGTDYMDTPGKEGDVVAQKLVDHSRRVIAEFGANPSGSSPSVAARLDGLLDTNDGGTITGPVTFTGADAFLYLTGEDPVAALQAVPKKYLDYVINLLFPGGVIAGTPNDGDAWVFNGTAWALTPTGL